ncbi:MAG: HAD family hydrolase [Trueperaceae bacterium]
MAVSRRRHRAVFLDKDGTLVENVPYNVDPALVRLTPGAGPALRKLAEAGFRLIVVSNQSGVARGLFPLDALAAVERRIAELLEPDGVQLDDYYYCPHHPQGCVEPYAVRCGCRKPRPGLLLRGAEEHSVELDRSWLVGDILDDVEAGCRAGCRTILLHSRKSGGGEDGGVATSGGETEWRPGTCRRPVALAAELDEAAGLILAADRKQEEERCDAILST